MITAARSNSCGSRLAKAGWQVLIAALLIRAVVGSVAIASEKQVGTISGRVTYNADKQRPWRFQRYYVQGRDAGPLAEAVVTLRGSNLRDWPAAEKPNTVTMDQLNFQFIPETLAIREGDSITFTNSDSTTHNVNSSASIARFSINLEAQGEHTRVFDRAGGLRTPVTLGCVYHGGMRAWIYVFDHPFFTVTKSAGTFRFENVPAGEYTLDVVHPAGQLQWKRTVTIEAGNEASVEIGLSPDEKRLK